MNKLIENLENITEGKKPVRDKRVGELLDTIDIAWKALIKIQKVVQGIDKKNDLEGWKSSKKIHSALEKVVTGMSDIDTALWSEYKIKK